VVRVSRSREPGVHLRRIAADFGISESCLANGLKADDVKDGLKPRTTPAETVEQSEAHPDIAARCAVGRTLGTAAATRDLAALTEFLRDNGLRGVADTLDALTDLAAGHTHPPGPRDAASASPRAGDPTLEPARLTGMRGWGCRLRDGHSA